MNLISPSIFNSVIESAMFMVMLMLDVAGLSFEIA
jgi:hypothetical protein